MDRVLKGNILEVKEESVHVGVSFQEDGVNKSRAFTFRRSDITFRGSTAPSNLITKDAPINIKFKADNKQEAFLDPNLEISAKFGYIQEIDIFNQKFNANDGIISYECSFMQLASSKGEKFPLNSFQQLEKCPILIFLNGEVIIECKKLEENTQMIFNLDLFAKNQFGTEDGNYFCFKDQRLIAHKIITENLVYKNTDFLFIRGEVNKHIGTRVEVKVNNGEILAEVYASPPNDQRLTSRRELKEKEKERLKHHSSASFAILNQNRESENMIPSLHRNISLDVSGHTNEFQHEIPNLYKNNSVDVHGYQIEDQQPQKINFGNRLYDQTSGLYYLSTENDNSRYTVLVALLEVCFRIPNSSTSTILNGKLQSMGIDQNILQILSGIHRDPNYITTINQLYETLQTYRATLEPLIPAIIRDPANYEEISEDFQVFIYTRTSPDNWESFHPFSKQGTQFPLIYFDLTSDLKIVYTQEIMQFDGYKLPSLEFTTPMDMYTNSIYCQVQQLCPKPFELFEGVLELKELVSLQACGKEAHFYEIVKKIGDSVKSLADMVPNEKIGEAMELYKKIKEFRVKDLRCFCGSITNGKYFCRNQHWFCDKCALAAVRFEKCCCYCEEMVQFEVDSNIYQCVDCRLLTEGRYFIILPCMCTYCCACADKNFNQNNPITSCKVHNSIHTPEIIYKICCFLNANFSYPIRINQ